MTKTKSTKRALLLSALSLLMCVSMLIGSTYAWFTDSVTSGSNVIQSGNLDIDVQYTLDGETWKDLAGATDLFQKGLWEPGHTEVVALKIENKGSLALKYVANMNIFNEVVGKNKDGGDIVLSDILTVSTLTQQANDENGIGDITLMLAYMGENSVAYETATSFKAGNVLKADQELHPGDAHYLFIKVDMAETVGNEANHDGVNVPSIEFGVNVLATQYTYENDSFGNQYDKEATYDESWDTLADTSWYNDVDTEFTLTNVNQLAGLAKLVNTGVDSFAGKTVKLANNVDLGNKDWRTIGIAGAPFSGTLDGNGKTVSNLYVEGDGKYVGLFGYVAAGVKVSNLTIENVTLKDTVAGTDTSCYGAAIGYCPGAVTLDNVKVTGDIQISTEWYVGGVIGRSKGSTITNCSVVGDDGSVLGNGRWIAGIVGYDNGTLKLSGCNVENVTIKAAAYAGGVAGLGAAGADVNGNTVKNVSIVLEGADETTNLTYGTVIAGVSVYSYSANPVYAYNNTVDSVNCTVNGAAVATQEIGSKYADGTDQGLVMMPTVKVGNGYYTYLKKAIEAAPKDNSEYVIELTGDTMITAKFKPSVAKNQNVVLKTNGYKLLWVEQDADKMPVTDADGNLVTVVVTDANVSSYITVKSGGAFVIE